MYESNLALINEKVLSFLRVLAIVVILVTLIYMVFSFIYGILTLFTDPYTGFAFDLLLVVGCGIYLVLYDIRRAYASK